MPAMDILDRYEWPHMRAFSTMIENNALALSSPQMGLEWPYTALTGFRQNNQVKSYTTAGTEQRISFQGGRYSLRYALGGRGEAWAEWPHNWIQAYNGAQLNPGCRVNTLGQVSVWDLHMMFSQGAAFPGGAVEDTTGFFWIPADPQDGIANVSGHLRPAAGTSGGMGIFLNSSAGGNAEWEFVAWDGGTSLTRQVLSCPDVQDFSTFRVVIISATPGETAKLAVIVNGVAEVELEFDGVNLFTPQQLEPDSLGFMPALNVGANIGVAGVSGWHLAFSAYFGRFVNPTTARNEIIVLDEINPDWVEREETAYAVEI